MNFDSIPILRKGVRLSERDSSCPRFFFWTNMLSVSPSQNIRQTFGRTFGQTFSLTKHRKNEHFILNFYFVFLKKILGHGIISVRPSEYSRSDGQLQFGHFFIRPCPLSPLVIDNSQSNSQIFLDQSFTYCLTEQLKL